MAKSEIRVSVNLDTLSQTAEALYLAAGSITAALEALATRLIDIQAQSDKEQQ